jgi:TolB-like protein/Tfp pilus assembly protein PilF
MKKQAGKAANPTTIRIHCLGHFRVEAEGRPLDEAFQAQRKPLALLKTLIALGGEQVPEDQLTEALWPDADGDAASRSFRTALYRLRQVFGAAAIRVKQRRVSLGAVWCDVRELLPLIEQSETASGEGDASGAGAAMEKVLALYRGPFLDGEFEPPEILVARDRLHGRVLRALREAGALLERKGERDAAIRLYQKGAEADPVAEELVQPLMRLLQREGRAAQAEAAYQRLRRSLEAQGGIAPSAETEAVHQQALRAKAGAAAVASRPDIATALAPGKPSVAVLPFTNMSGELEQEYFSDGITEEIITGLARFQNLSVIARYSSFQYKGRSIDVRQVGQELGARFVIEGSVRRAGHRIRVAAQLVDSTNGAHRWAETYERKLTSTNIFGIQDQITAQVVGTVADSFGIIARAALDIARGPGTDSLDAYESVLRAYAYYRSFSREKHLQARACLERAVELDPGYPDAWAWLAAVYRDEYAYGYGTRADPLRRAEEAVQRALEIDPMNQEAHIVLAQCLFYRDEIDAFLAQSERALAVNPNSADLLSAMGAFICYAGKWEQGLTLMKNAAALNPNMPGWLNIPFYFDHYRRGEFEQALLRARRINMPEWYWTHVLLAAAYGQLGRRKEAESSLAKLLALRPDFKQSAREILHVRLKTEALLDLTLHGLRKAGLDVTRDG